MTMKRRSGETVIDWLMSTVIPIVGAVAAIVTLLQCTTLPKWACFILGLPLGTIGGWLAFVVAAAVVLRLVEFVNPKKHGGSQGDAELRD